MTLNSKVHKKYITVSPADHDWGLHITTVGHQSIGEDEAYPPQDHPTRYLFNTANGRTLNEYQLLYIAKGKGMFNSRSSSIWHLKDGYMFLLFPGEWHTYMPDESTGWNEYWIGFNGKIMEDWVKAGFFSKENPVFNVGLNEELISLYKRAVIIADSQEANYQQALAGIVCNLLSMAIYLSRNKDFSKANIAEQMNKVKIAVHENINTITPEQLADTICMSYSKFRKIFREYTGFAPSQYIQQVKINMAKEMLTHTSKQIKEIALDLGYDNKDYFFTIFKKVTGFTPVSYRKHTQGE